MENLELKHISPYLPYGLKIKTDRTSNIHIVKGLLDDHIALSSFDGWIDLNYCKPILRHISDLYNPCLDGETPIIELAKIMYNHWIIVYNTLSADQVENEEIVYRVVGDKVVAYKENDAIFKMVFESKVLNGFAAMSMYDETILEITNQFQLFQQLFEWHFDIFGLIEKGLAIDINTL